MTDRIRQLGSEVKTAPRRLNMLLLVLVAMVAAAPAWAVLGDTTAWSRLADVPDPRGLAGHFAGIHNDVLIIAGGANFDEPVWQSPKLWHDAVYVLPSARLPIPRFDQGFACPPSLMAYRYPPQTELSVSAELTRQTTPKSSSAMGRTGWTVRVKPAIIASCCLHRRGGNR